VDSETDMHILDFGLALPYASIPARVYNLKVVLPEGSVFEEVIFLRGGGDLYGRATLIVPSWWGVGWSLLIRC
jgi:hypothetical protein